MPTTEPPADPSGEPSPGKPTLSQRGRNLLADVRTDERAEQGDSAPDGPVSVAFVAPAEEGLDAELAALALARQLAGPTSPERGGGATGAGVALLMLDPLGATLRLCKTLDNSPLRAPVRPQYRAANRDDWPALLARLPRATRLMLILDTTGQQHRLLDHDAPPPTVIVVTTTGGGGRVAGYRKLKELDQDGVGQIGFFFVDGPAGESLIDEETLESAVTEDLSAEAVQSYLQDGPLVGEAETATEPLTESAQATFARLAATADQFLARRLAFFGDAAAPGASRTHITVDLLGQRPSIDGHENRSELSRWLAANSQPLEFETPAEFPHGLPTLEPTESASASPPPYQAPGETLEPEPAPTPVEAQAPAEPVLPQRPAVPIQDQGAVMPLEVERPAEPQPATPPPPPRAATHLEPVAPEPETAVASPEPQPASQVPLPSPAPLCSSASAGAPNPNKSGLGTPPPAPLLPVVPLDGPPGSELDWSSLLAAQAGTLWPGATALDFRCPADPPTVLIAAAGPARLVLVRPVGAFDPSAALAGLLAAAKWARQHWPLLRLAYADAALPAIAKVEPILVGEDIPESLLRIASAGPVHDPPVKMIEMLRVDLSAVGTGTPRLGVALREIQLPD